MAGNLLHTVSVSVSRNLQSAYCTENVKNDLSPLFCALSYSLFLSLFPKADTPSQRVQFLLGMEDEDEEHIPHALFTELDEICLREGEDAEWKETARYYDLHIHTHIHTRMHTHKIPD